MDPSLENGRRTSRAREEERGRDEYRKYEIKRDAKIRDRRQKPVCHHFHEKRREKEREERREDETGLGFRVW